jgi:hypothetical protein
MIVAGTILLYHSQKMTAEHGPQPSHGFLGKINTPLGPVELGMSVGEAPTDRPSPQLVSALPRGGATKMRACGKDWLAEAERHCAPIRLGQPIYGEQVTGSSHFYAALLVLQNIHGVVRMTLTPTPS